MDAKSFGTTCSRDAISRLPDEVLGNILSLLPTKQAASTSVLAKRWRNVFRLVDNLDFDDSVSGEDKLLEVIDFLSLMHDVECKQPCYVFPESFKNFVDRTLALQCDYQIKKFSLKCHVGADRDCEKACVSRWISNVVERGVLELDLGIKDRCEHFMPPLLFASKTLVKLTLGTRLSLGKLPSAVSLPSLKTLFIDTIFFDNDELSCVLLAGCPVLEELSVHHEDYSGTPLNIFSPTVKRLSVDFEDTFERGDLSLNLPNLVYLEYSDYALSEYPQVSLESLVEAKLDLHEGDISWTPDVTNLFFGLRNVEILHLSSVSIDVIYRCVKRGLLLPVFDNLINLSFVSNNMNKRGWKLLAYLLQQTPKLETLIIQDLNGYTCNDVSTLLNKVKVLHILSYGGNVEELKKLKSLVDTNGRVLLTKRDLKTLLGVSLPSKALK